MIFLIIPWLSLFSALAQEKCSEVGTLIQKKVAHEAELRQKSNQLEVQLKQVLHDEIIAQVEKRAPTTENQPSGEVYYQLRNLRLEAEQENRSIKALQTKHCGRCTELVGCKEGGNP